VSGRRASVTAVLGTLLGVGVLLLMVMFAARSGPQRIFAGPLRDPNVRGVTPSFHPPTLATRPHVGRGQGVFHDDPFFVGVAWVVRLAILVCVLWLLRKAGVWLLAWFKERMDRRKPQPPRPVDFDVLDDPEPLVTEIRKDADLQFDLLLGGEPRNAIVACWDRFEEQAERVGASRQQWETSSEFILRLLDLVSADSGAVGRLERLYHEARFSEHDIDESRREAAVEALEAIHRSLGIGARTP
jgi:hypothetical protein